MSGHCGEGRQGDRLGRHGQVARLRGGLQGVRHPPPHLRGRQPAAPDQVLARIGSTPSCLLRRSSIAIMSYPLASRRVPAA
jgi:hypothetical protein